MENSNIVDSFATCETCGEIIIYVDEHDSFACKKCCIWMSESCGQDDCYICSKRPATPEGVYWDDVWNGYKSKEGGIVCNWVRIQEECTVLYTREQGEIPATQVSGELLES